ncbi:MAG: hypothetical protein IT373_10220 [Polyangiaceae bacterium]|nr:hypothetical protein [Polyangiaceae bacterium]
MLARPESPDAENETMRWNGILVVPLLAGLGVAALATGSCHGGPGGDDGGGAGGGGGSTSSTTSSWTTSTADCGCSCAENPDDLWLCGCPGSLDQDCCADADEPTCPPTAPAACEPGTFEPVSPDGTWSCSGCVPALVPACPAGCPVCTGSEWSCSSSCPGAGGAAGAGGAGGAAGAGG